MAADKANAERKNYSVIAVIEEEVKQQGMKKTCLSLSLCS
jgi:hypothetical protein